MMANCDSQPHKKLLLLPTVSKWLFHQLTKTLLSCRSFTALVASLQTLPRISTLIKRKKDPNTQSRKTPTPDGVVALMDLTYSSKGSMNEYIEWLLNHDKWWSL